MDFEREGEEQREMHVQNETGNRLGDALPLALAATHALSLLGSGEAGFVCRVTIEPRLAKRLADLGFIAGARVEMIRPGRPCIVRINGTRVGLGRGFQERVFVDLPDRD